MIFSKERQRPGYNVCSLATSSSDFLVGHGEHLVYLGRTLHSVQERDWKCSCDDRSHRKCSIGTVTFTERAPWHYLGGVDTEGTGSQGEGLKTGRFGVSVKSAPRAQLSMQPLHTAVCGTVLPELAPPDPALQRMPNRPEAWIQLTI